MSKVKVDYISDLHLLLYFSKLHKLKRTLPKWVDENLVNEDGSRGD